MPKYKLWVFAPSYTFKRGNSCFVHIQEQSSRSEVLPQLCGRGTLSSPNNKSCSLLQGFRTLSWALFTGAGQEKPLVILICLLEVGGHPHAVLPLRCGKAQPWRGMTLLGHGAHCMLTHSISDDLFKSYLCVLFLSQKKRSISYPLRQRGGTWRVLCWAK